mmetsp:Transcript_17364/g.60203  ORF Transcript_17364/g.60203 Transcript_17364/m.60203 type:complete len:1177 (+) Transcript_17364:128-3658(+)
MRRASAPMRLPLRRLSAAMPRDASTESRLFVRNLPRGVTRGEVRKAFEAGGCAVRSVVLPENTQGAYSGKPRGFAFVTVPAADAKSAREKMHGSLVRMNEIVVELAEKNSAPASTPRRYKENHIQMNKWIIECADGADVLNLFKAKGESFDAQNLATSFHRIGATIGSSMTLSQPLLDLVKRATESISGGNDWGPQGLANVAWGVARLSVSVARVDAKALAPLFSAIATAAPKHVGEATSQNMANLVWAFAKSGVPARDLFDVVADAAINKVGTFGTQDMANTCWAFAKAGVRHPELFSAIGRVAEFNAGLFSGQDLSVLVWAFATAGVKKPFFFKMLAAEVPAKVEALNAQSLATVVWAFAKTQVQAPALFQAVAHEAVRKITTFNAQNLTNTVWAFSNAGVASPRLFDAVAAVALLRVKEFNAQNLASIAWTFSTAGPAESHRLLFKAIALEAPSRMPTFQTQMISRILAAYATAGLVSPALFAAAEKEVLSPDKLAGFNAADLALLIWAFATARVDVPVLFEAIAERVAHGTVDAETPGGVGARGVAAPSADARVIARCTSLHLALLAWSFAKARLDDVDAPHQAALLRSIAAEASIRADTLEASHVALIAWAYATLEAAHAKHPAATLRAVVDARPLLFESLAKRAMHPSRSMAAQDVTMLCWAYAKNGAALSHEALLESLGQWVSGNAHKISAMGLVNVAWAFATARQAQRKDNNCSPIVQQRLALGDAPLFAAISRELRANGHRKLVAANAQELSNIAWSFAKSKCTDAELFRDVAILAADRIDDFLAQEIAVIAWSFSSAGLAAPQLFDAVAVKAPSLLFEFEARELAMLAWALAKHEGLVATSDRYTPPMRKRPRLVWSHVNGESTTTMSRPRGNGPALTGAEAVLFSDNGRAFGPPRPASQAYFEKESRASENLRRALFASLATASVLCIGTFSAQNLALTAWSIAKAGVEAPLLFEAVSAEFPRKMHGAKPSDFSMTLWAAATVRVDAPMLFDAAAKHLVTNPEVVAACIECELADLLWAYARAGVRAPQLFHILTTEALRRDLSAFPAACLAQMAWAVCTSSHDAPDLLDGVSAAAVPKLAKWIDAELSLLYQVYVVRRLEAGNSRFVEDLRGHEEVMRSAHHRSGKAGDLTFSVIADMTDLTLSVMADMTDADMQSWLKQTPTL